MFALSLAGPAFTQTYASTSDIKGHWAEDVIEKWVQSGLASGYPDGTFKPDSKITRAKFAALVNCTFGFKNVVTKSFPDVKSTDWFYSDIMKAVSAGYLGGYEDKTMRPGNPVTSQEVAMMLSRVLNMESAGNVPNLSKFKDSGKLPEWSRPGHCL